MSNGGLTAKLSVVLPLAFLILILLGMVFLVRSWYFPIPSINPEAASTIAPLPTLN
jgi:hypothetical protein